MTTRTWRAKRRIGAAALVALIGSTLAFATPAGADDHESMRYSGDNRYETAVAIGDEWDDCDDDAVVVNGSNWPDGLAAASMGYQILLVEQDSIPAATAEFIEDCVDDDIYIVGGEAAVSSDVFEDLINLSGGAFVERLAGANRYETALAVADWWDDDGAPCDVILATGENFPDALAAGPLAWEAEATIVLNSGSSLRADVKAYLATMEDDGDCDLGVPTVHIIGGTSAVPASIETEINTMGIDTNRIAGANRYETAVAVAETLLVLDSSFDNCAILVNGSGFADALAAGPWGADWECPLMLTNADSIPAATAAWHAANCEELNGEIYVAGGEAVVSDAVHLGAIAAATCLPVEATATLSVAASGNAIAAIYEDCDTVPDVVRLTGIDGSGAGGLAGNEWDVDVYEAGDDVTEVVTLDYDTKYLEVKINIDAESGTSGAEIVEAWNDLSEANLLFEASLGDNGATVIETGCIGGVDQASTDNLEDLGTQEAYVDQVVTIAFNQAVTQEDDVDIDNGTIDTVDTSAGDSWVVTMERVYDPSDLVVAGTGFTEVYYDACSVAFPSICNWGWIDIG